MPFRPDFPRTLPVAALLALLTVPGRADTGLVIDASAPHDVLQLDTAAATLTATGAVIPGNSAPSVGDCAIDAVAGTAWLARPFAGSAVFPYAPGSDTLGAAIALPGAANDVDLSPDGRWLAVSAFNAAGTPGPLSIVDTAGRRIASSRPPATGDAQSVAFCDDGVSLVYGDDQNRRIGLVEVDADGSFRDIASTALTASALAVHNVACAPGSRHAVAGQGGGGLEVFALPSLTRVAASSTRAQSLAFSPDGGTLYTRTFDGAVRATAFDPASGQLGALRWVATVGNGSGTIGRDELAVSGDGLEVLAPSGVEVIVLDAASGAERRRLSNPVLGSAQALCLAGAAASFRFVDVVDAPRGRPVTSNEIVVGGSGPQPLRIDGGTYSVNGARLFASRDRSVQPGDRIRVRGRAPYRAGATASVVLTVGSASDSFDITSR